MASTPHVMASIMCGTCTKAKQIYGMALRRGYTEVDVLVVVLIPDIADSCSGTEERGSTSGMRYHM